MLRRQLDAGAFTRAVLPWLVAPPFYRQTGQVEGMIQFAERNPVAAGCPRRSPARRMPRPGTTAETGSAQIQVPCLVLVGELDLLNPPRVARELAERLPARGWSSSPASATCRTSRIRRRFRREIEQFLDRAASMD